MKPRKFIYEESGFCSGQQIIRLKGGGLEFGEGQPLANYFINKEVSLSEWKLIEESIKEIDLEIKDREDIVMDGVQVSCWITFRKRLVKFEITNPDFPGYIKLRNFFNNITMCNRYPEGIFN